MGRHIQGVGDFEKSVNGWAAQTTLDLAVMGSIQSSQTAQDFLRKTFGFAMARNNIANQFCADHTITPFLPV